MQAKEINSTVSKLASVQTLKSNLEILQKILNVLPLDKPLKVIETK